MIASALVNAMRMNGPTGDTSGTWGNVKAWLTNTFAGPATASGVVVTEGEALSSSAVLCAVRNLAEPIAMLPFNLLRREYTPAGRATTKSASDHPLHKLVHLQPRRGMTSFEWREWMMYSLLFYGNSYTQIVRNGNGDVIELSPLFSYKMLPKFEGGSFVYDYDFGKHLFRADEILHVRGFFAGGLVGLSLKDLARETIATTIAQDRYAAGFFGNNATPPGYISHPAVLSDEAEGTIARGVREALEGFRKNHNVFVLDEGMKWEQTGVSPEDAQLVASRQFQIAEVCRIFNLPPHRLHDLSKASFNNIEHMGIELVQMSFGPWIARIEQRCAVDLLTPQEQSEYLFKINVNGLQRGDFKARTDAYHQAILDGWMSQDDVRELEDLNPLPDDVGTHTWMPINMAPVAQTLAAPTTEATPQPAPPQREARATEARAQAGKTRLQLRKAYRAVIARESQRVIRAELREVRKMVASEMKRATGGITTRARDELKAALYSWYKSPNAMPALVRDLMSPIFAAYSEAVAEATAQERGSEEVPNLDNFVQAYIASMAEAYGNWHYKHLSEALDADNPETAIEAVLTDWEATGAEVNANMESVKLGEAAAKAALVSLGVTRFVWRANAGACPLCRSIDGNVVGVESNFASEGDVIDPGDGKTSPLTVKGNIGHAPLHEGCKCMVVAE